MSVTIEQDSDQWKLAYSLQSRAEIQSVRLVDANVCCKIKLDEASFPLNLQLNFTPEETTLKDNRLSIPVSFCFKISGKDGTEAVVILCRLEAAYDLAEGFEPNNEEITAFKKGNAIFNCWPYFREYVQNSVTRMDYPAPTVPYLRLVPKPVAPKEPPTIEIHKAIEEGSSIASADANLVEEPPQKRRTKKRKK